MNTLESNFWSFFNDLSGRKDIGELREIVIYLIFLKQVQDELCKNLDELKSDIDLVKMKIRIN